MWKPTEVDAPDSKKVDGVFSHLISKQDLPQTTPLRLPTQTITWEKFKKEILLDSIEIEFLAPSGREPFGAIVTASVLDSPPILQWDHIEQRNPFSLVFPCSWFTGK